MTHPGDRRRPSGKSRSMSPLPAADPSLGLIELLLVSGWIVSHEPLALHLLPSNRIRSWQVLHVVLNPWVLGARGCQLGCQSDLIAKPFAQCGNLNRHFVRGADGTRTRDPLLAKQYGSYPATSVLVQDSPAHRAESGTSSQVSRASNVQPVRSRPRHLHLRGV